MGRSKKSVEATRVAVRKRDPVRFLVVGDFMTDVYWHGVVTGLSAEAPIPKVQITLKEVHQGGAGNVLANLRSLGATVICPNADYWSDNEDIIFKLPIKNRLIVGGLQIARWDENDSCKEILKEHAVLALTEPEVDRIVIADYNKGAIGNELLAHLYELNLPTFVDTKRDPTIYVGWVTAIFPNLTEYERYADAYNKFERCVVTEGPQGASVLEFGKVIEKCPAFTTDVVSVCGAGDTFSAAFAYRWPRKDALQFANLAAAVVVGKPLTSTVSLSEISDLRRKLK